MPTLSLSDITKRYTPETTAVDRFSMDIADGEFIVFLGPSGCGKSTILRMVAGLEDISGGTLKIEGRVVNDVEPRDRNLAMVFQDYALFPHMTVEQNIGYGLKVRNVPKADIATRARQAAESVNLGPYLARYPSELSGGQRQRVALARAIVRKAPLILMDEPLSNLDAKMRVQMRAEILSLHKQLGTTSIYVTHDQTEAMTMADRIVVMRDGRIQQIGAPTEIYRRPANDFVAAFVGTPPMNLINLSIADARSLSQSDAWHSALARAKGEKITLGFRPEAVGEVGETGDIALVVRERSQEFHGHERIVAAEIQGQSIQYRRPGLEPEDLASERTLRVPLTELSLFDAHGGGRLA